MRITSFFDTSFCPVSTIEMRITDTPSALANSDCVKPALFLIFFINSGKVCIVNGYGAATGEGP